MKFNEVNVQKWTELKPYMDTCLLPISGILGTESPVEVTAKLELLRDWLDVLEIPFKGRMVTYPAVHYILHSNWDSITHLCSQLKLGGFGMVVVMTLDPHFPRELSKVDAVFGPDHPGGRPNAESSNQIQRKIQILWSRQESNLF